MTSRGVPLVDGGYVNFKYPVESSARHAVAISAIVEVLQRSLASRKAGLADARRGRDVRLTIPIAPRTPSVSDSIVEPIG